MSLGSAIASENSHVSRSVSMDSDFTNAAKPQFSSANTDVQVRTITTVVIAELLTIPFLAATHRPVTLEQQHVFRI